MTSALSVALQTAKQKYLGEDTVEQIEKIKMQNVKDIGVSDILHVLKIFVQSRLPQYFATAFKVNLYI